MEDREKPAPFLRRDSFLTGAFTGVVFPAIIYVLVYEINESIFRPHYGHDFTLSFQLVVSVVFNILPFMAYSRARKDNSMRGIMTVTFVFAFVLVAIFYHQWMM